MRLEALRKTFGDALRRAGDNPWLLLLIAMLVWGANAPVIRAASGDISPMVIVNLRWAIVGVAIWFFGPGTLKADLRIVRTRPWFLLAMAAMMTASNAMIFTAAKYTTAINLSILQGAAPVIVIIGARIAHATPIRPMRALGVTISLAGVILLACSGDPRSLQNLSFNFGDLLMISSVALYSVYILALRDRPKVSNYSYFCFIAFASYFLSLPLIIWEVASGLAIWPNLKGLAALLYVALFTSMLGQIFFMRSVELIGAARASLFQNLPPVIGAILSVVFLGEIFQHYHLASLTLVIGGIVIAERLSRR